MGLTLHKSLVEKPGSVACLLVSITAGDLHRLREGIESFIEVVHLCEDTDDHDDNEDVCRGVSELVVTVRSQFQGNAKSFRGHDRDRSSGCTDR